MFEVIKLEGEYWAVFLVNPIDTKDRYMLTSPLNKEKDALHFKHEFERISNTEGLGIGKPVGPENRIVP